MCETLAGSAGDPVAASGRSDACAASKPFLHHCRHHHRRVAWLAVPLAGGGGVAATEPACPGTRAWSTALASTSPHCGSGRCCSRPPSPRCRQELLWFLQSSLDLQKHTGAIEINIFFVFKAGVAALPGSRQALSPRPSMCSSRNVAAAKISSNSPSALSAKPSPRADHLSQVSLVPSGNKKNQTKNLETFFFLLLYQTPSTNGIGCPINALLPLSCPPI